jgi:hypothetical protein
MSQAIKCIYSNLNIVCCNETDSLLQQNLLVCNLIITYKVYVSIDVVQHAVS